MYLYRVSIRLGCRALASGGLGRVGNAKALEDIAVAVLTINHPNGTRDLC